MCFAVGSGSLGHGLTCRLKLPKSALSPDFWIFQGEIKMVQFCTRWCSSVILRNGSGKRVAQMISHKRDETEGWLQKSPEQEINGSYNKNGEIEFSEICGIKWSLCSLY